MVALVFVTLMFLTLGGGDGGQTFARVAAVVLAVLVSADELGVVLGYYDAARVARETVDRLAHIDMADLRSALTSPSSSTTPSRRPQRRRSDRNL